MVVNFGVLRTLSAGATLSASNTSVQLRDDIKTIPKQYGGRIPSLRTVVLIQTGVNVMPSQWTQAEQGSTGVEIAGAGDKRQLPVTLAGTLSGKLLPFQILYKDKTERCHPLTQFLEVFDIWHTPYHWANGEISIRFVKNIIFPYISITRNGVGLGEEHMAVVIFDTFKGHTGSKMESLLLENNIISIIVPSNCTDVLQPLELSVNKPLKDHLRSKFQSWYSE